MSRAGLAVLTALALALGLLGPASARTGAAPKYGGTLVVGLTGGDPDSLDPTTSRAGSGIAIYPSICERLYDIVRNHGKVELAPLLAASQPLLSKDKRSYTIQLRKGIRFNDGTPFNAQAVVTSVQRMMTLPTSSRASDWAPVESVSAAGPYTVVFRLKTRGSALDVTQAYVLSPTALAKQGASFGANPVCVGPFMFDHRVAGDHVTVVKSPYYYDQENVYLDKIVYKMTIDASAAAAALRAGDIQALDQVSTTQLPAIQSDSSLGVLTSPQLGWRGLFINVGNKSGLGNLPYANVGTPLASSPMLRRAFEEAIDRDALNRIVFGDLYQTTCTPIPPANTAWYPAIKVPCTPYDPADAKKLIARSGTQSPTVRLLVPNQTDTLRLAQAIQAQEAAVGINVVIDSTDNATVTARMAVGNFEVAFGGFQPGTIEPNTMLYQFFATSGVRNYSGYSNPRVDYVLNNGLKATKVAARAINYREALETLIADRPTIFLYNISTLAAYSTSLTGMRLAGSGQLRVANARFK